MGIVKRQSIKTSVVNYVGVAIGMLNVLLVYPHALEAYGTARFFIDTSMLLIPFILVGMNVIVIKFFPTFQDDERHHHGFLSLLILGSLVGMVLFVLIFFLFKGQIYNEFKDRSLVYPLLFCLVPLTCLRGFCELLIQYTTNFHRIVIPSLLNQLIKITLPALIILYIFELISIEMIIYGVILNYGIVMILLFVYLKKLGQLHFKTDFGFLTKPLLKELGIYASYGIFGLLGSYLALRIDTLMVMTLVGELSTGRYGVVLLIANVIEIPTIALMKITAPFVSKAWEENDLENIKELYKKTSINLLIFGILIFVGLWTCLDDLLDLIPNGEEIRVAKYVVLFVGLAKLIDMATSINNQIIGYSKYFRFNFYAILFMAGFNIVTNIIFIPIYQETGAALATLASLALYNLLKFSYVKYRFGFTPFSIQTIWILLLGGGIYFIGILIPDTGIPLLNIALKSVIITGIYCWIVLNSRLSPDINDLALQLFNGIKSRIIKK